MSIVDEEKVIQEQPDVIDIDLSETAKQRFRIDGDNNRILLLNTSDFGVIRRLNETYPKLTNLAAQVSEEDFDFNTDEDEYTKLSKASGVLDNIDRQMREYLDYIFDSNVSEVCAPSGTMYDLANGKFRFEHIIEKLSALYDQRMRKELSQMSNRLQKHTRKYSE